MKTKNKKIKNKRLEELWHIVANYIKSRDSLKYDEYVGICVSCGTVAEGSKCQAGHYVPSYASKVLRYHPHNIHIQCRNCNVAITKQMAEKAKVGYARFMYQHYGNKEVNKMLDLQEADLEINEDTISGLIELYLQGNEKKIIKYLTYNSK